MKFAVITHVSHAFHDNAYFAYGPYVKEMNIWFKHVDEVLIVAPINSESTSKIDLAYQHSSIHFFPIASFSLTSIIAMLQAVLKLPGILFQIYRAMCQADHIHLRCPGNVGLLACLVQILFPNKTKTAKYAGNWDPNAKQPLSYRLQKWILSNTFLTKNMQVLVYGEWEGSTKNIKPFFTATYKESDKLPVLERSVSAPFRFLFVGTLSKGKRPLYVIQLIEKLSKLGHNVMLDLYGEGTERKFLEDYISMQGLSDFVFLHGNQTSETVQNAYKKSHFLVLPSQSEGWPKVIAEAMFWGCVPIATPISCVSKMLENESGLLLEMIIEKDVNQIQDVLQNESVYLEKSQKSSSWSRKYTLDYFESEIQKLLL
jgi:glycosyltransferase involved in cell wall biosynthesis